tara:strand:+ start:131 stop:547 length:417 start_codon:yes stop_codon:yes gene_type:complete
MNINDKKTLSDFIPNYPKKGDKTTYIVKKGKSNNNVSSQIELESVINSIKNVQDPEIPVNIYDLGLIYDIEILSNNDVKIKMSLTAPGCPVAGEMPQEVADTVCKLKNVGEVEVELIWDPPWTTERMSEDARLALDIG